MSMLNAAASYRRGENSARRVPVVLPLVDVRIDEEGNLSLKLDREPCLTDDSLQRSDLKRVLDDIAADLGTPIRVEMQEADGSTFTDIVTPGPPDVPAQTPTEEIAPPARVANGARFLPLEDVTVAVVVAHQTAGEDGEAHLRLPPALLEAHPGRVVLVGRQSGTIVVSGEPA